MYKMVTNAIVVMLSVIRDRRGRVRRRTSAKDGSVVDGKGIVMYGRIHTATVKHDMMPTHIGDLANPRDNVSTQRGGLAGMVSCRARKAVCVLIPRMPTVAMDMGKRGARHMAQCTVAKALEYSVYIHTDVGSAGVWYRCCVCFPLLLSSPWAVPGGPSWSLVVDLEGVCEPWVIIRILEISKTVTFRTVSGITRLSFHSLI